jgi:peptidoglycan/xylan/chitin deacetylase (PgdA/CDA1 family)
VARIALKIDVDTFRGTREGAMRLADLLERLGTGATFLFSVGPDHTGRAIRRAFRAGFLGKVRRTSVLTHYGLRTLLYGTLLPGPHIGRRCGGEMREIARRGFDVGVHCFDHVKWQDGVATASEQWARRELERAHAQFTEIFARPPLIHGAAGWQVNRHVPALERSLGFRFASDVRGERPFLPVVDGEAIHVPQLPTTLPTLDELIGRPDLGAVDPVDHLFALTAAAPERDHVFTLHAELEGGVYLPAFERLLRGWRERGYRLADVATSAAELDVAALPRCPIVSGSVPGRAGVLAIQGMSIGAGSGTRTQPNVSASGA